MSTTLETMNKINCLSRDAKFDPRACLARVMELGDDLEQVAIVFKTKDGPALVQLSTLDTGFLSLGSILLQREVSAIIERSED